MNKLVFHLQNDIKKIENLEKSQFAIPKLDWEKKVPLLIGKNTLQQMILNMSKHGFNNIIELTRKKTNNKITLESLEQLIEIEIKNYLMNRSKENLIFIFHLIQLWGGNAGRMFYFKGSNIDFIEYEYLISKILTSCTPNNIVLELKKFIKSRNTKFLNIAFVTKHISLWQRFGTNFENPLPIYDSIIAKNIMGVVTYNKKTKKWSGITNNDWKSLECYWENMLKVAKIENVSTATIERQLFNFFRENDWNRNYGY